jgi:hypothetical protein
MIRAPLLATALATALAIALAGCSPRAEEPILGEFFHASRLRDRTALQKLATTSFEPAVQGIVRSFDIIAVTTRRDGDRTIKDVSISAPVAMPSGQVVEKRLVVTLEQRDRRWVVTAITDGSASGPSTPPS